MRAARRRRAPDSAASAPCCRSTSGSSPNTPWRGASIRPARSTASPRPMPYLDGVVRSVAALPGVDAVGLSDVLPLGRNRTWGVRAKGVEYPQGQAPTVFPRIVDQHYLQAMQIPLRAGRFFDARDTPPVKRRSSSTRVWRGGCGPIGTPSARSSRRGVARQSSAWSATSGTVRSRKPAATRCICTTGRRATGRGWKWSCAAHGRPNHWCRRSAPRSPPTIPACRTASSTSSGGSSTTPWRRAG